MNLGGPLRHIKLTSAWASQGLETQPGDAARGVSSGLGHPRAPPSITSCPSKNTWFLWTAFSAMGQYHEVIETEQERTLEVILSCASRSPSSQNLGEET